MTIVIPCYNHAQYLDECIKSCLDQTVPAEIIVVDDGSTDNSLEVARKYPVKVISQVNKGLSSARNAGIMSSTQEYILFLDSDDKLAPNAVERIQEVIDDTNADIVSPSFQTFGLESYGLILMKDPKLEDFKTGNRVGYCSAVRRDALLEVGGYSPKMTFGYEDLHLWVGLLSRGKTIVTIPEILWFYRTKEKSMIHDAQAHHQELMNQIFKDFPNFKGETLNTPLPQ